MFNGVRLQKIADRLCDKFGLDRIRMEFAEELTKDDIKTYTFLFCPTLTFEDVTSKKARKQLALIPATEKKELAEAKKNILWKEYITNPKMQSLTSIILKYESYILEAAIYICKNKSRDVKKAGRKFRLNKSQLEVAERIANKMKEFHAEGLAIKEFRDLAGALKRSAGKMPLVEGGASVFEQCVHETIHYILIKNDIQGQETIGPAGEPFDEGVCTYFHFRIRWFWAWFFRMYLFGRGAKYRQWSKYFKAKFKNVPDREIGTLLKKNLKLYAREIAKMYPI